MIITQTPLRISFFGGGTDYPEYFLKHGGAVLGTAIDKSSFIQVSRFYSELFDYNIRIGYSQVETVSSPDEIDHNPFRECLKLSGITEDVEVNYTAELPSGTGLGSSSSFVVGLLNGLHAYQGKSLNGLDLAYKAIHIERQVLGESVGCQDQTFAAVGGFNLIEFIAEDKIVVNRIPLSPEKVETIEDHLLVFFTGIKRKAEHHAKRQVDRIGQNLEHLRKMRAMVDQGYTYLTNSLDISKFGELLHQAWLTKRSLDSKVSNPAIDHLYSTALENGAFGGKLMGAGGGGFIMFLAPPEKHPAIKAALPQYKTVNFRINAPGSRIIHT